MALSTKTTLFVCLLVAAVAVVPAAAQLDLGGIINYILTGVIRIQGIVFCSVNGTATVGPGGVTVTPPFSNATVQLRCGAGNGTVVAFVQTNAQGYFSILLDPSFFPLTQLVSGCRIVVATPLASCNATLPLINGTLSSTLTQLRTIFSGFLPIFTFGLNGFTIRLP